MLALSCVVSVQITVEATDKGEPSKSSSVMVLISISKDSTLSCSENPYHFSASESDDISKVIGVVSAGFSASVRETL